MIGHPFYRLFDMLLLCLKVLTLHPHSISTAQHHLCQYFYSYMYAWGLLDGKLTNTNLLTLSALLQLLTLTAIETSCGLS